MKYKVLMYGDIFVDSNKLHSGTYEAIAPHLYPIEKDIDDIRNDIIACYEKIFNNTNGMKTHLENLYSCRLVEIELNIIK